MYDIRWIREHPEAFDRGLTRRGLEPLSRKLLALDEKRRALITRLEQAQARRNAASKEIGQAKAKKDESTAQNLMAEVAELKDEIGKLEGKVVQAQRELFFGNESTAGALATIPNLPFEEPEVPTGKDETQNRFEHESGEKRKYDFKPKQHFELGEALGQMDFETAAKLSGARFVVLQKDLARMERALGQFMLDVHTGPIRRSGNSEIGGYTEVNPPILVRDDVMFGTTQLPKFEDDQFPTVNKKIVAEVAAELVQQSITGAINQIPKVLAEIKDETGEDVPIEHALRRLSQIISADMPGYQKFLDEELSKKFQLWLIPTAEVPLTNLVRESIVAEDELPMRFTACTPCFRAEAGAAGKDTRGMIRQHQFTKVELVSITTPEQSRDEHERMLACAEEVLKKLDLHYRVVTLCTGDMGFAAQKTYDIEVWLPGQGAYREISSCSVCGDFQAQRMKARYRGKDGKVKGHVHTLNGSGVAVGRALIAVMETYQQKDGSVVVPEALQPYMGGVKRIERAT
jgi:seryl-tRNA synthetase